VPISLIVTLESVKLIQGKMIIMDPKMKNSEFESRVNCSSTVEDLGTVEFIASDKTGTLTKNQLTLKEIYDGRELYLNEINSPTPPLDMLEVLSVCHEAYVSRH
jgi:phospholipid-transporting ATPase